MTLHCLRCGWKTLHALLCVGYVSLTCGNCYHEQHVYPLFTLDISKEDS